MRATRTFLIAVIAWWSLMPSVVPAEAGKFKAPEEEIDNVLKFIDDNMRQQKELFSSNSTIAKSCYGPFERPNKPEPYEFFSGLNSNTVSLPYVDCIYIEKGSDADEFVRFKTLPDKSGFLIARRTNKSPFGFFISLSKHPLHEIQLIGGPAFTVLNRISFKPSKIFPIKAGSKFTLIESQPRKNNHHSKVWVEKSFIINRKGKIIDQLHVLIRDREKEKTSLFGKEIEVKWKEWYLYSQTTNTLLDRGKFSISCSFIKNAKKNRNYLSIKYFRNRKLLNTLKQDELLPIRDYMKGLGNWSEKC